MNWQWLIDQAHKFLINFMVRPDTVGVTMDLGSGADIDGQRAERRAAIRAACEAGVANPEWVQRINGDGTVDTFCNRFFLSVAHAAGCFELDGKLANEQIHQMAASANFRCDTMERAHRHAMRGGLAIAGLTAEGHGHVCPVADEPMQDSGSWGKPVVMVWNVGRAPNGLKRVSQAFKTEPLFFLWRPDEV